MNFSPIELFAGILGVVVFAIAVQPTPVLGAVVVFILCQIVARAIFVSRRR